MTTIEIVCIVFAFVIGVQLGALIVFRLYQHLIMKAFRNSTEIISKLITEYTRYHS